MAHRITIRTLLALVILTVAAMSLAAQTPDPPRLDTLAAGRLFVLAFPDTVGNERNEIFADTRFNEAAIVMVYAAVPTRIRIIGGNGIARWSAMIDSGRMHSIDLMRPEFHDPYGPISPSPSVQRKNAFRLEADHPVIVYCYMETIWGGEAWTPLPVESWGTEYYAAAVPGDVVSNVYVVNRQIRTRAQPAPSEIVIVAAWDDTQVSVYPNGPVLSPPSVITLDANEAFQLRSFVDTMPRTDVFQPDLGGSYIVATRPIGVVTGNTRTAIIDERTGLTKNSLKGMAIEWLAPVDAHGREMVFTPVVDELRVLGTRGEATATKRPGEVVRVYGTTRDSTRGELSSPIEAPRPVLVSRGTVQQIRLDGVQSARVLRTDAPVQAMATPAGVIRAAAGGGYDTWSAFMTELVPREQWTSFAPFLAPSVPTGMRHYVNIVTDSFAVNDIYLDGRRIRMNMGTIAGSDLVWGTTEVSTGYQHVITSANGAKFTATAYGLLQGSERTLSGTYREYLALSYGHALAPRRRALAMRDSLVIDSVADCRSLTLTVRTAAGTIETIRSVRLAGVSNARFSPSSALAGPMLTPSTLHLQTIDTRADASATLLVEDRAGRVHRIEYARPAELATLEPAGGLFFGEAMAGDTLEERVVLRNRSRIALHVRSARLLSDGGFSLPDDPAGASVDVDGSLSLRVSARPVGAAGVRRDTVIVALECGEVRLPVSVSVVEPCLEMSDLDFGTIPPGAFATRVLRICNRGRGRLSLLSVAGDSALVWDDPRFSVNPVFLDILRTSRIGPSECLSVEVYFGAERVGRYTTTAHASPSAGPCRDSSVWTAVVSPVNGVGDERLGLGMETSVDGRSVTVSVADDEADVAGDVWLDVHDALGREVAIGLVARRDGHRWRVRWDASSQAAGVYYCSLRLGDRTVVRAIALR